MKESAITPILADTPATPLGAVERHGRNPEGPLAVAPTPVKVPKTKATPSRSNDPERTMREILEVATEEFAKKGLAGARIDEIAAATRTSKRMIYYYFESKESLYVAVLEEAYRKVRQIEGQLHLEQYEPREALRRLVIFTFEHHLNNQSYIRLVMSENMQHGSYLAQSKSIQDLNVPAISTIAQLYQRGLDEGVFRPGLTPLAIHASISALTFFNVSNAYTFGLIFKLDTLSESVLNDRKAQIVDLMDRYLCLKS